MEPTVRGTANPAVGVVGVGYEGRTVAGLVAELIDAGVSRVVDVRLTPLSRKRGFSRNQLRDNLAAGGIAYEHRPELGNPKENRAGFGGSDTERAAARAVYASLLRRREARRALTDVAAAAAIEKVALLCFEADNHRCHRQVVLSATTRRLTASASKRTAT
jgi:uncharacterized protein (DUF488 family)